VFFPFFSPPIYFPVGQELLRRFLSPSPLPFFFFTLPRNPSQREFTEGVLPFSLSGTFIYYGGRGVRVFLSPPPLVLRPPDARTGANSAGRDLGLFFIFSLGIFLEGGDYRIYKHNPRVPFLSS